MPFISQDKKQYYKRAFVLAGGGGVQGWVWGDPWSGLGFGCLWVGGCPGSGRGVSGLGVRGPVGVVPLGLKTPGQTNIVNCVVQRFDFVVPFFVAI